MKLDDDTNFGINIKWLIQIVLGVGGAVWVYFTIMSALSHLEIETMRHNQEIELNSEFRIKWPRGEMGSLPADSKQDLQIHYLEEQVGDLIDRVHQLEIDVTKLQEQSKTK